MGIVEQKKAITLVHRKSNFCCVRCGRKLGEGRVRA